MLDFFRRLFAIGPKYQLPKAARSANVTARQEALRQMGDTREPWATNELIQLLMDINTPVREASREALRRQGKFAVPALLQALNSPQNDVSVAAADLLGESPTAEAVEPLLTALKYSPRPVQLAARRALGKCGAFAIPVLRSTSETQPWVRQQIADALAEAEKVAGESRELAPIESAERA